MNHQDKEAPYHLAGWVLFLACSFFFLYVALRDSDIVLVFASLLFLAGCVAFLIPLLFPAAARKDDMLDEKDDPSSGQR